MATDKIYVGNVQVSKLYAGSSHVKKVYKGSTLIYEYIQHGLVLINTSTPGTYTINVPYRCTVHIDLVGAGSGGNGHKTFNGFVVSGGGSGGYVSGNMTVNAGNYTVVVGAGSQGRTGTAPSTSAGGQTSFNGQIAKGGGGHEPKTAGAGGGYTKTVSTLTGVNGNAGSVLAGTGKTASGGASKFGGYGKGGNCRCSGTTVYPDNGGAGYCKIYIV